MQTKLLLILCFLLAFSSCKKPETKQVNNEAATEMETYQSIAESKLKSPILYKESPEGSYVLAQHIDKSGKTPMGTANSAGASPKVHALVIEISNNKVVWETSISGSLSWENDFQIKVQEVTATVTAPSNYLYDIRSRKRVSSDGPRE